MRKNIYTLNLWISRNITQFHNNHICVMLFYCTIRELFIQGHIVSKTGIEQFVQENQGVDFVETFNKALDQLETDAKSVGLNFTSLCRQTKISRATPDRWRKNPPTTIVLLSQMQEIVRLKRAEIARNKLPR